MSMMMLRMRVKRAADVGEQGCGQSEGNVMMLPNTGCPNRDGCPATK